MIRWSVGEVPPGVFQRPDDREFETCPLVGVGRQELHRLRQPVDHRLIIPGDRKRAVRRQHHDQAFRLRKRPARRPQLGNEFFGSRTLVPRFQPERHLAGPCLNGDIPAVRYVQGPHLGAFEEFFVADQEPEQVRGPRLGELATETFRRGDRLAGVVGGVLRGEPFGDAGEQTAQGCDDAIPLPLRLASLSDRLVSGRSDGGRLVEQRLTVAFEALTSLGESRLQFLLPRFQRHQRFSPRRLAGVAKFHELREHDDQQQVHQRRELEPEPGSARVGTADVAGFKHRLAPNRLARRRWARRRWARRGWVLARSIPVWCGRSGRGRGVDFRGPAGTASPGRC